MRIGPELLCLLPVSALASERALGGDQLPGYCPLGGVVGYPPKPQQRQEPGVSWVFP